jgi:hypothetical protein
MSGVAGRAGGAHERRPPFAIPAAMRYWTHFRTNSMRSIGPSFCASTCFRQSSRLSTRCSILWTKSSSPRQHDQLAPPVGRSRAPRA